MFLKIFLTRARFKGYHDPTFVDLVWVLPVQSDLIRSDPGFVNLIRSDPILVLLTALINWNSSEKSSVP